MKDTLGRENRKLPDRSCPHCGTLFRCAECGRLGSVNAALLAALREFVAIDARDTITAGAWGAAVVMAKAAIARAEGNG